MKQTILSSSPSSRALQVLVLAAAFMVIACDSDVNFTPTAPDWPEGQFRLSMISGNKPSGDSPENTRPASSSRER